MARIKKITFASVAKNEGCTCDRCGQYIKNIWTVTYQDDVVMNFGIDCFEKVSKEKLNAYGMKQMKKVLKSIQDYTERLEAWKSGEITEDCAYWQNQQAEWNKDSYWYGRKFEEYKDWMINEFFPARLEYEQKELAKFKNVNFNR